jgi:phosphatidylserine/phosphatidylglycerophosphate/cardiolipin synthase-like enzyme
MRKCNIVNKLTSEGVCRRRPLPCRTLDERHPARFADKKAMPLPRRSTPPASPRGEVELVVDETHFHRVVLEGILRARVSIDIATADFKAMLVPKKGERRASSIVEILRDLADEGVEIRLLHAGTPSAAALVELKKELPANLTIRRCPRLHAKAVIIDCQRMYLGSANLTGAGLGAKADGRRNFEMGLWTGSASLIDAVLEQFNALWEGRRCLACRRKEVCPVPLEEPLL